MATDVLDKIHLRGGLSEGDPAIMKTAKTAAYTAKTTDGVILCDATGAGFTVTLPAANADGGAGICLTIKLVTATANTVTVAAAGSDTIEGAATSTILVTTKKAMRVQSDGATKWFIVAAF